MGDGPVLFPFPISPFAVLPLAFTARPAHPSRPRTRRMADDELPAPDPDAIVTRTATPRDAAAISAIIELYVPGGSLLPRSPEFVAEHAADFIVAERGARVVGCVHLDDYAPSLAEVRSLAVSPAAQAGGVGARLVQALEALARRRAYATLFAVSNNGEFFRRLGYAERVIPELDRERSAVSRFKGVYAKDL